MDLAVCPLVSEFFGGNHFFIVDEMLLSGTLSLIEIFAGDDAYVHRYRKEWSFRSKENTKRNDGSRLDLTEHVGDQCDKRVHGADDRTSGRYSTSLIFLITKIMTV